MIWFPVKFTVSVENGKIILDLGSMTYKLRMDVSFLASVFVLDQEIVAI